MHIISYRGPGQSGGVSAALARAWDANLGTGGLWWHLESSDLRVSSAADTPSVHVATLPQEVIKGHYRFCNEFLWPIMHDLPQYARYVPEDRAYYDSFNQTYGWCVVRGHHAGLPTDYFVQDYQLAFLPAFLKEHAGFRSLVFWHIPWPKSVEARFVAPMIEFVRGLLSSEAIGFHTQEYAENFVRFVAEHMPEYGTSEEQLAVWFDEPAAQIASVRWGVPDRSRHMRSAAITASRRVTRVIVAPLGIDFEHWTLLASNQKNSVWHPGLVRTPFVLSVDRADYTKGVVERIKGIDMFFESHPEWIGKIVFAQICGKTRTGLESFDGYWRECQRLHEDLKSRWGYAGWQPLLWIEESFSSAELAHVYRAASAMLITAVRDGLNLTAKEYVACQNQASPGVLALSRGAGAWHEIGKHTVSLEPNGPQIADAIHKALTMDSHERQWRMALLKHNVRGNSLSNWWYTFSSLLEHNENDLVANYGWLKESS